VTDDDVIEYVDPKERSRCSEAACHIDIIGRWRGISGRMDMRVMWRRSLCDGDDRRPPDQTRDALIFGT